MAQLPIERAKLCDAISELIDNQGDNNKNSLTGKMVRDHLQEKFKVDLKPYKKIVDKIVMRTYQKKMNGSSATESDEDSDNDESHHDTSSAGASTSRKTGSESDSDHGVASTDRFKKDKTKRKKREAPTEEVNEDENDLMSVVKKRPRAAARAANANLRKTRSFIRTKKPGNCPFTPKTKLCYISDSLQKVTHSKYMRRCDVVSSVWNYVRVNNLTDPKDKRYVLSDSLLQEIVKKNRFLGFGMMKILVKHVIDPSELGSEFVAEADVERDRLRNKWMIENEKLGDDTAPADGEADADADGDADADADADGDGDADADDTASNSNDENNGSETSDN
ncbi:unnamed protein product [Auanema sp. JU1783]|nr:unnamed protein product [Auanema sp. JU1783]